MWYTLKTEAGEEEIMKNVILQSVPTDICGHCLVIKREKLWRNKGMCYRHIEVVFPGMVMVVSEKWEQLREQLKKIPYYDNKMEYEDNILVPISNQEEQFLLSVTEGGTQEIIPLSPVDVDEEGEIITCGGVLAPYRNQIVKKRIRNRYVLVRIPLTERNWDMYMGICLPQDKV